jgi:uncharacterized membrane protein HdeD (DUF308 family)
MPPQPFMTGILVTASGVAGLFFLKFWRRTRDRLFLIFAVAFWMLGINWLALAFTTRDEAQTPWYIVRLAAFLLILAAVIDKNRSRRLQ